MDAPLKSPGASRWYVAVTAAVFLFFVLAIGNDLTRAPWWDEGLFADVALNFRNFGHLGSSILTPNGFLRFPEAHRYTFWQFPLYLVTLGYWLRVFPATILGMRLLSSLFGLVYIGAWFVLIRALSRNTRLAILVACTVALDYSVIGAASDARMDMMCAAMGLCSLAAYCHWRRRSWGLAITVAACFSAASLFCHPMGFVMNALLVSAVLYDRRRVRPIGLLALLPYAVAAALCVRYIDSAPKIFWAQTKAQSGIRTSGLGTVVQNVLNDVYIRYLGFYFYSLHGVNRFKMLGLLFAGFGVLGLLLTRRTSFRALRRVLLIWSCVAYVGVAVIDNQKFPLYFVYSMPFLVACATVWTYEQWQSEARLRIPAALLLAGSVASSVAGFAYKIHNDDYRTVYLPAMRAISDSLPPGGIVMGGSELAFAFGFSPKLIDDRYLGFGSSIVPQIYASNYYYGEPPGSGLHQAWLWSRRMLKSHYRPIFKNSAYTVFLRDDLQENNALSHHRGGEKFNLSVPR